MCQRGVMKIGILSDTHGNVQKTAEAAELFRLQQVGAVFHCGDIGSNPVLSELEILGVPVHAVSGNMDVFSDELKCFPDTAGVHFHGRFAKVEIAGKTIALLHGDDRHRFQKAVHSGQYDFVLTGHTHAFHDFTVGKTRCINPGTAGKGSPGNCVVLDLESGEIQLFEL